MNPLAIDALKGGKNNHLRKKKTPTQRTVTNSFGIDNLKDILMSPFNFFEK